MGKAAADEASNKTGVGAPAIKRLWLIFAVVTTVFWGVWGAFIEIPEKAGFPATLGYTVWALVMIPPALVALAVIRFKLEYDLRSIMSDRSSACSARAAS